MTATGSINIRLLLKEHLGPAYREAMDEQRRLEKELSENREYVQHLAKLAAVEGVPLPIAKDVPA